MDADISLIEEFAAAHPEDVARVLEEYEEPGAAELLAELGADRAAQVLREMVPVLAARRLERLPASEAARTIEMLGVDSAAALLRRVDPPERRALLGLLPDGRNERSLRLLLAHAPGTAGAVMDPLVLAVPADVSAREALDRVRADPRNAMFYVYVLGGKGELVGVLNHRELMLAPPEAKVSSLMTTPPQMLQDNASVQAIVAHPAWQRVHALPVVDKRGTFLGAIRYKTARKLEYDLGRAVRAPSPEVTARALGELYALAFGGLGAWALPAEHGPSQGHGEGT